MFKLLFKLLILSTLATTLVPQPSRATNIPIKYQQVSVEDATRGLIPVTLYFGKVVTINFTGVAEQIYNVTPSDRSGFVYNGDLPLESGQARVLSLLPVKRIDFKGNYQTSHPNLVVRTVNGLGETKQYNFLINFSSDVMTNAGITIVPPAKPQSLLGGDRISVSAGQTINADAVEGGLRIAIAKQFVKRNDPEINQIRNFIFMMRNGNTLNEAIVTTGVNPAVIESLGELYLEAELPPRLRKTEISAKPDSNDWGYLEPLLDEIEAEENGKLRDKLWQAAEEIDLNKNPRPQLEEYGIDERWIGKIMKAYLTTEK